MIDSYSNAQQFDYYKDIRVMGSVFAFAGFVTAIVYTCALAGMTDGFQPSPGFYQIICPILYGMTGSPLIGGLIAFAIASAKMRSLSTPSEDYKPYTEL